MSSSRILLFTFVLTGAILALVFTVFSERPAVEGSRLTADEVRASGKCIECHARETGAITVQFADSKHAKIGVTCLDCHKPTEGQEKVDQAMKEGEVKAILDHNGFRIVHKVVSGNCMNCHRTEYKQFLRSRHGPPAWTAVKGGEDFKELKDGDAADAWKFHKATMERKPNALAHLEGPAATNSGCMSCHSIGQPNPDGSIGDCSSCHARHEFSVAQARRSETCGRCHMGPDHAQFEIWSESSHGVLFAAREDKQDLTVPSEELTTKHQDTPTCSTCHMSGLNKMAVTHDTTERLSYYLFKPISDKRPGFDRNRVQMQQLCSQCHVTTHVEQFYARGDLVVEGTNKRVEEVKAIMDGLRSRHLITKKPFDEEIEFKWFDYWHYFGRTAKHGAFMNGGDFVQWHGSYELTRRLSLMKKLAHEIEEKGGSPAVSAEQRKKNLEARKKRLEAMKKATP